MLPKFEYSHLHKFVVSTGLLLVALAVAVPLFVLRESSLLLVPEAELRTLTPTARRVMEKKQADARWLADHYAVLSVALALVGGATVVVGLFGWKRRQDVEDSIQQIERNLREATYELTRNELQSKRADDVEEIVAEGAAAESSTSRAELMQRVAVVEERLLGLLAGAYRDHLVRPGVRFANGLAVDALLVSMETGAEYLVEFKYAPTRRDLGRRVRDVEQKLLAGVAHRRALPWPERPVQGLAVFVTAEPVEWAEPLFAPEVRVVFVTESRLDALTPEELRAMIDAVVTPPA